jgi:hypothetical protein
MTIQEFLDAFKPYIHQEHRYSDEALAAFFDGEGYIGIWASRSTAGHDNYHIVLGISQVDRRLLDQFVARFGGSIYLDAPRNRYHDNAQPCWKWRQNGADAANTLQVLVPFLVNKRKQAVNALRCRIADPSVRQRHFQLAKELKRDYTL